jgi:formylglycine-generating enzyme required for sulfatase activity
MSPSSTIRMLDTELRLITPVDPEGPSEEAAPGLPARGRCYQLTHDYLVHSLRDWLTGKQRETIRGRAEIRLATITASWCDRPEPRRLPSPLEWLSIIAYTRGASWSSAERRMMRHATWHFAIRALAAVILGAALGIALLDYRARSRADRLVAQLMVGDTGQVPSILAELDTDPGRVGPGLDRIARDQRRSPQERLHAYLSLLPTSRAFDEELLGRLLQSDPDELMVIAQRMRTRRAAFAGRLWDVASAGDIDRRRKFRAACALATLDPDTGRWRELAPEAANALMLDENAFRIERWLDALRPVRQALLDPLAAIFRDRGRAEDERFHAAVILQQYAADQPRFLVELIQDADVRQASMLLPALKAHRSTVVDWLSEALDEPPLARASEDAKDGLASRQANCAIALLLLDKPEKVWPLLRHSPEPMLRGHLLDRIQPMGVDPRLLAGRLRVEQEASARRALLLALAGYRGQGFSSSERAALECELVDRFQSDPDPGMHSAAERALRDWGRGGQVDALVESFKGKDGEAGRRWYVNSQGHTMVVSDPRGQDPVLSHSKRIDRVFAIATKEVSVPQWLQFRPRPGYQQEHSPFRDCPISVVTWYDAAAYCRWLSEQERVPESEMCFPRIELIKKGMRLPPDYLRRTGYRLPTQAEAEYACRAGALTTRFFGSSDKLLPRYAYFRDNSQNHSWHVGSLWPNDLGLFDILGNALEWCQECRTAEDEEQERRLREGTAPERLPVTQDREDTGPVSNETLRPLRGGDYGKGIQWIRSDRAEHGLPVVQFDAVGFRAVRTQRPQP